MDVFILNINLNVKRHFVHYNINVFLTQSFRREYWNGAY